MTSDERRLVVLYRRSTLVPPYDCEDILLENLRSRDDVLRSCTAPTFKLDIDLRIVMQESGERQELFTPMSMAEYCLWNTLSVKAFMSGGHFFLYADDTGVLLTAKNGSMRIRVIDVFEPAIDWSIWTITRQPCGEGDGYRVLDSTFELPADVDVFVDVSMPVERWLGDNLKIAEEYVQTVQHAVALPEEGIASTSYDVDVVRICEQCERALSIAYAELEGIGGN